MQTPATAPILPPRIEEVLTPLLASLPAASISPSPPTALLPKLSPILRQRVQILSSTGQEPWLSLLCYDAANAPKLEQVVKNEAFEPHPVSGEVELDWDNMQARYKRVDEETLQCIISLFEIQLSVKLIWCVNDEMGGGDGWRIGEVNALDTDTAAASEEIWGQSSIPDAERAFETSKAQGNPDSFKRTNGTNSLLTPEAEKEEEDDDDDYWAQYDNTPARTPGPQRRSPNPQNMSMDVDGVAKTHSAEDEASYYAQYSSVQPAMDNHDPDEAQQNGDIESPLGKDEVTHELQQHLTPQPHLHSELHSTAAAWSEDNQDAQRVEGLAQPRPGSSAGSCGSDTVARLEQRAAASAVREQSEVGIKQHIGTSVKSLYRLAKVAGIDRREFERVIRTEVDCLGLMDEGDD